MKKYDAAQASMLSMFDKALPFFLQAEKSDANDKNTLIALREIYARKNQMDKAEEYKKKMEAL
jgi:DNA-directed RNA polymerase subunit K/omega